MFYIVAATLLRSHLWSLVHTSVACLVKGRYRLVTLPRTVTPYRDSVDGTQPRNITVGYAVTLRAY
jgi:hypothetical protein